MKKAMLLISLTLVFLFAISAVSAVDGTTYIAGKVYDSTQPSWPTVEGATVEVTCNGGNLQTTTTVSDGSYSVTYSASICDLGDSMSVYAYKGGLSGYGDGNEVSLDMPFDVNVGVSNVPLVPEFGFLIGTLTIISSIGVFFFVRRQ